MPDEIQNAGILDEIKSNIRLGGFHHAVISSEFCEDFTHRQVDLIERTTHLNGIKCVVLSWRKRWDSNPRALADNRISSVVGYWFIVVNIAHYRLFGTRRKRRHYCH